MREVTDETFDAAVLQADGPVVVDFWAPWCGPCKTIEPALERLAAASPNAEFVRLDIDANPVAANRYGVLSLPTVILFERGEARETIVGARSHKHYARTLERYL